MYKYRIKDMVFTAWENNEIFLSEKIKHLDKAIVSDIMFKSVNDAILIIDDEEDLTDVLADYLSDEFSVFTANTLKEATILANMANIGLAFVDLRLRYSNGMSFAQKFKNFESILMTGFTPEDARIRFEIPESMTVIGKPFDMYELQKLIRKHVHNYMERDHYMENISDIKVCA